MSRKLLNKLQSRKLFVGFVGYTTIMVNGAVGNPIDEGTIQQALIVLGTYLVGQGIADHGRGGGK